MFYGSVHTTLGILTYFETATLAARTLFVHSADYLYVAVWYYERHHATYFVHLHVRGRLLRGVSCAVIYDLAAVTGSEDWP
jgi:hypothetical protein